MERVLKSTSCSFIKESLCLLMILSNWSYGTLPKRDATRFFCAVKKFGNDSQMRLIAAEVGGSAEAAPVDAQVELFDVLLDGCREAVKGGTMDPKGPLLDFFGAPVKANDVLSRVEELQLLAKRVNCYNDPISQFQALMYLKPATWSKAVRKLIHYKGQPDPLKGDALNKSVRETAQEALSAIFAGEDNSKPPPQEGLTQRIQGFGNTNFDVPSDDKKSFLSDMVGIGSATIKQGLNSLSQAQTHNKNDTGTYRGPNLRRSLTNESSYSDSKELSSQAALSSRSSTNASGSWSQDLKTSVLNGGLKIECSSFKSCSRSQTPISYVAGTWNIIDEEDVPCGPHCYLQVVRSIASMVDETLRPQLMTLLPCIFTCVRHSHVAVRLSASRCITSMAKSMTVNIMGSVIENIIPMLGDMASVNARQGVGMLTSLLVQGLGTDLVPYARLLVVPLLRCMSDCDHSVRRSVTHSFAALVPLLPLARGVSAPPVLSECLLSRSS
ncbi:unnamed protein product [Lactuca virosa]|uniref:Mot1 central domain-containing protein n=1 Tax=Lactuca virosa TaxID=75947 RepID=A0AAU9MNL2_9ASTR|nr:unnamed protein product [Lactuca virosa]